jgi:16S rRNA processing protein RimM
MSLLYSLIAAAISVLMRSARVAVVSVVGASVGAGGIARAHLSAVESSAGQLSVAAVVDPVDASRTSLAEAAQGADLIILCSPVGAMLELVTALGEAQALAPGAIVTDVGSVKARVVAELTPAVSALGGLFIGSHPMAGSENAGMAHARPDLFRGAACLITPLSSTPGAPLERLEAFWRGLGMRVSRISPEDHDQALARVSHLPHAAAAALTLAALGPRPEDGALCGNGLRDSTRIAKGGVIARCKGIETKEQADALKGLSLHIARSALPEPDEDEFYLADLIGLAAVNPEGQRIGRVKSVQDFGAGDILEIDPAEGGPTWYLPFTREAVPDVRISAGQIIIVRPDEVEWVPETGADPDETPQD